MNRRFASICLIGLLAGGILCVQAQNAGMDKAREKAARFLSAQQTGKIQKAALRCAYTEVCGDEPLFYVFNGDNAYVMVAEDESLPILAYATGHTFDSEHVAPAQKMWMDSYRRQIAAAKGNADRSLRQAQQTTGMSRGVEPLLDSRWNQGIPYNYFCPKDDKGQNGRCVTGCVATAMAQLMYYFRWPESGTGSYSYTHEKYGELSARFDSAHYDYGKMCDMPSQINAAASLLCHHCGVAVDMVYGPGSSGMYNHKAAYALRTYFRYSPETKYIFRDSNGMAHDSLNAVPYPLDWDSVIIAHLERNIPLYYAGWSKPWTDGHGFICDGYRMDSTGNCWFHFNFGWGGSSDGYFLTASLYPGSSNFNIAQELVINAYPDTAKYTYPQANPATGQRTLNFRTGSFEHPAAADGGCLPNTDYTWHLLPDTELDTVVSLNLHVHCRLDSGDVLMITSNNKSFRSIYLEGKDTAFDFSSKIYQMDFRLMTTGNTASRGIHCSYETVYPEYCTVARPSTKASATLSDGSGSHNYNSNACCRHIINVKGYEGINLRFHYLETEKSADVLRFYDYNRNDSLLLELSGRLEGDSTFYLPSNVVTVEFTSDDSVTGQGWSFTYTASKTAVKEAGETALRIYPNPAHGQLNVLREDGKALGELRIFDLSGRRLMHVKTEASAYACDVSAWAKGMYLLQLTDENGTHTHKFVRE